MASDDLEGISCVVHSAGEQAGDHGQSIDDVQPLGRQEFTVLHGDWLYPSMARSGLVKDRRNT